MSESNNKETKVPLPYSYSSDAPVDLRVFPKHGDKIRASDYEGNGSRLIWACEHGEILEVTYIESEHRKAAIWYDAGYIHYKFTSTEGKKKYPGTHGGAYFHRFTLVEQAKTEAELLEELNSLIVVQQEDE